jgi:hypothetical protein
VRRCTPRTDKKTREFTDPDEAAVRRWGSGRGRAPAGGATALAVATAADRLLAQVHRALGDDRFDELFAADAGLSQRESVAAVGRERGVG